MRDQQALSFADKRTHFELERGAEDRTGGHINEPTGVIRCDECGASHTNIDDIPHEADCPQRFVHSRFYVDHSRR